MNEGGERHEPSRILRLVQVTDVLRTRPAGRHRVFFPPFGSEATRPVVCCCFTRPPPSSPEDEEERGVPTAYAMSPAACP